MLYNDRHPDYLLVKDDEPMLLDYLATLVAKEYVVYNNPAAPAGPWPRRWSGWSSECAATSRSAGEPEDR